ncbi:hypothetical protein Tco_0996759 [Tanacetum coccineum]
MSTTTSNTTFLDRFYRSGSLDFLLEKQAFFHPIFNVRNTSVRNTGVLDRRASNYLATTGLLRELRTLDLLSMILRTPCCGYAEEDHLFVVLEGGNNLLMNFETRSSHVRYRSREGSFSSQLGRPPSRVYGKSISLYRYRDVRIHRLESDLVEITDVSMRVFFVMSEELFVLNEGKQIMLKLKVVRGDFEHNDGTVNLTVGLLRAIESVRRYRPS